MAVFKIGGLKLVIVKLLKPAQNKIVRFFFAIFFPVLAIFQPLKPDFPVAAIIIAKTAKNWTFLKPENS